MSKGRGPDVVEHEPEEPRATSLAASLGLRRNARVGLAVGLGLAVLLYVPTLLAVGGGLVGPGGYYLGLALVLAATVAGVVTAGLCGKAFLEPVLDRRAWLRRGGTAAIVGGVIWMALPAVAWLAAAGAIPTRYRIAATSLAALALAVGTAGLHAAVRAAAGRVERAAYLVVVLGLLLAAGNATGNTDPIAETAAGPLPTPFLTSAFVAVVAAVPFAATAELAGRLPPRRIRALQVGALASTLSVAGLVALGGWSWLDATAAAAGPIALAVVTVPAGLGWTIAGHGLRSLAKQPPADAGSGRDSAREGHN